MKIEEFEALEARIARILDRLDVLKRENSELMLRVEELQAESLEKTARIEELSQELALAIERDKGRDELVRQKVSGLLDRLENA